jgi:hypothetical protein
MASDMTSGAVSASGGDSDRSWRGIARLDLCRTVQLPILYRWEALLLFLNTGDRRTGWCALCGVVRREVYLYPFSVAFDCVSLTSATALSL